MTNKTQTEQKILKEIEMAGLIDGENYSLSGLVSICKKVKHWQSQLKNLSKEEKPEKKRIILCPECEGELDPDSFDTKENICPYCCGQVFWREPEEKPEKDLREKILKILRSVYFDADVTIPDKKRNMMFDKILVLLENRQELTQEYKKGYNQCLREQGLTGEKHQGLYL